MAKLLSKIENDLENAINEFLKTSKILSGKFVVRIVSFHNESIIEIDEIDMRAFMVDEVWCIKKFNLKVLSCQEVDGSCYVTVKAIV